MIAGGTGALGLQTAGWLVRQGARELVLTGRRGASAGSAAAVAALRAAGATVQVVAADVGDAAAMAAVLERAGRVRGVVQAAGTVALAPGRTLTAAALTAALAAKVRGSWLLHTLSGAEVELFVGYSSIAAVWGSKAGRVCGGESVPRPAGALPAGAGAGGAERELGPVGGGGLADEAARAQLARLGVGALTPADGLAALETVVASGAVQVTVAPVAWGTFRAVYEARGGGRC